MNRFLQRRRAPQDQAFRPDSQLAQQAVASRAIPGLLGLRRGVTAADTMIRPSVDVTELQLAQLPKTRPIANGTALAPGASEVLQITLAQSAFLQRLVLAAPTVTVQNTCYVNRIARTDTRGTANEILRDSLPCGVLAATGTQFLTVDLSNRHYFVPAGDTLFCELTNTGAAAFTAGAILSAFLVNLPGP